MLAHRENPAFELVPAAYRLRYRGAGADATSSGARFLEVRGCDTYVTQDVSVAVRFDGEVLSFEFTALAPVTLELFQVELAHEFGSDEHVLLNGYQSWTTTRELPASARMRGYAAVSKPLVGAYALDGIGDYRFTEYFSSAGCQHGFTYGVLRRAERNLLVASLDERNGFTLIRTDAVAGNVVLEPECPQVPLDPGETMTLAAYALLEGSEEEIYSRWFQLSGVQARPVKPLIGYSSWYRHYGDIDQGKLARDLEGARAAFAEIDGGPATRLFQVDDGFCCVGDWLEPDTAKFPDGMAPLAASIRDAGFLPGLWMAPFVCEKESRLYAEHPDWLLQDDRGHFVRTGPHWSGAYALDTRNPHVREHVRRSVRTAVDEWGFGLLKLDFLYVACMLPHDGMNRGQLMDDALRLLREAAGEDVLFLLCGVPLGSAFGVADYCRIGCDVGLDWNDKPHMRLLHRERVSTKHSLGNTLSRAPLDGRAFGNDPDVFFLRDDVKFSAKRRRGLLEVDARCGSVLLTSDDMGRWGGAERKLFQAALDTLLARWEKR